MRQQTGDVLTIVEKILKVQEKILDKQEQMQKSQDKMQKSQEQIRKEQEEMKKEQQEMREELTKVGNTVTKIEYEHGQKIDLILDILTGHGEKLEEHERRFEKDEKIIELHGHKIYAIEQKI